MTFGELIDETPITPCIQTNTTNMIHNAECHIDGRICVEEKVLFDHAGVTLADLNRIFPEWEKRMPQFVRARWPEGQITEMRLIVRQAIITGMMYAVEEIMKSRI